MATGVSTVRHFNASCPDCNRWRCVCLDAEAADILPEEYPPARETVQVPGPSSPGPGWPVRTGPPPTYVRTRLAELRDEFAKRRSCKVPA